MLGFLVTLVAVGLLMAVFWKPAAVFVLQTVSLLWEERSRTSIVLSFVFVGSLLLSFFRPEWWNLPIYALLSLVGMILMAVIKRRRRDLMAVIKRRRKEQLASILVI